MEWQCDDTHDTYPRNHKTEMIYRRYADMIQRLMFAFDTCKAKWIWTLIELHASIEATSLRHSVSFESLLQRRRCALCCSRDGKKSITNR